MQGQRKGQRIILALSLLRSVDRAGRDRPAFTLASCSLAILNPEFLCVRLLLWVSTAGALPRGQRMEWACSVRLMRWPTPRLGG